MLIPGTVLQGRYRIIRQIGGGGQALVYLAEDTNLGDLRAIKELTPDANASPQEQQAAYDQFEREARILTGLNHPHLVYVWEHFRVGDNAYLIMDYIDGQTLEEIVDQTSGFLPEAAVQRWAGQLCDVLDYLHRRHPPIIFRDLKPSNVMLDRNDTVKLIDFGIARLFLPGKKTDTLKMGTMGYAPPEQYAGKGQTDTRSDVYSLGATLHHLLTKRDPTQHPPFSFDTAPPRSLNPVVSPHVEAAITKSLAYDRVQRFQSVREMKRALMSTPTAPTPTVALPRPVAKRRIELRWPLLGLAALFVVLVWFLVGRGEPGPPPTPTVAPAIGLVTSTVIPMPTPTVAPMLTPEQTAEKVRQEVATVQAELSEEGISLLSHSQAREMLNSVYQHAIESGVEITDFQTKPSPEVGEEGIYDITPFRWQAEGAVDRLVDFASRIRGGIAVENITITENILAMEIAVYTSPYVSEDVSPITYGDASQVAEALISINSYDPISLALVDLRYDNRRFTLKIKASDRSMVVAYARALKESQLFSHIDIQSMTSIAESGSDMAVEAVIVLNLSELRTE